MTKNRRIAGGGKPAAAKTLWAYGYEMVSPHPDGRIADIRELLERQNAVAALGGRTWSARLVTTRLVHVLVVSESPQLDTDINRALEQELTHLGVHFLVTAPMRVSDEADAET
jgi:hypothetical protein